mgnify:CR=1 FL=1
MRIALKIYKLMTKYVQTILNKIKKLSKFNGLDKVIKVKSEVIC